MGALSDFGETAKGLARNPLGIIALFIVLIYGFASLVLTFGANLQSPERLPIVWFLVLFPVLGPAVFGWLVSRHHAKLYAPKDYTSDEAFLQEVSERTRHTREVQELQREVQAKVREVLTSAELARSLSSAPGEVVAKLEKAAEEVSKEIAQASSVTVDAREFTGRAGAVFLLPVAAFATLSDLTNEVYFALMDTVKSYEYGYSSVLKNKKDGTVIKTARMITGTKRGVPLKDSRSLPEVGITGGTELVVVVPK